MPDTFNIFLTFFVPYIYKNETLDITVPTGRWEGYAQVQRSCYDIGSGVRQLGFGFQLHYLLCDHGWVFSVPQLSLLQNGVIMVPDFNKWDSVSKTLGNVPGIQWALNEWELPLLFAQIPQWGSLTPMMHSFQRNIVSGCENCCLNMLILISLNNIS